MRITVYSDGGARGNPGPAGCGYIIYDEDNIPIKKGSEYIGQTTNNQAEYKALILALTYIKNTLLEIETVESVRCYLDSELVVKQLNGEYKVKNPDMILLFNEVRTLVMELGGAVIFEHIRREKNKVADQLANDAMDQAKYLQS